MRFTTFSIMIFILTIFLPGCGPSSIEKEQIGKFKQQVAANTNDPESVQFKNIKFISENKGMCGEINYKNKMGGYEGFKVFAVSPNNVVLLEHTTLVDVTGLSKMSKKERNEYMVKTAAKFMSLGAQSEARGILWDSVMMNDFDYWGDCYSDSQNR